ncbi:putative leucine-rich repeat-containing protein DDB_G0290503 [Chironomus tepperi]|uniref:putative leucine-rich repeat-containing protein DDB_G0290503 n=1 Tax=Chironomus tepperi TaxID=113505 RepID=UPI00391F641E
MSKTRVLKTKQNQADNINMTEIEDCNSSIENLDLTLLRRPIATSITGLEEVLRAYKDGTNELKKLLSKECDLIYECKVCRNIFRSLTNFISHKRVYCRNAFNASDHFHFRNNGFMVQDVTAIIEAEQKNNNNPIIGVLPGTNDKSKDLSGVVEHILWKQHQSGSSNATDVLNQINSINQSSFHLESVNNSQQTLLLNPVNESDIAVYQSLQTESNNSKMEDEIKEVHNMLKKSNSVLGPDGKIINQLNLNNEKTSSSNGSLVCKVCNVQFETEKTLKLHLEMKHLPSSYVYQCPSCTQKFSSSATVLKHLSNDHNKSNRKIRLMRDNIIKKRIRAEEAIIKCSGTSRELQQLQLSNASENNRTNDSEWNIQNIKIENDIDDSYVCPSCLKKFDRKAVYTSHVQMCSDIKDREQEKLKKRKAKDGAKIKQLMGSSLESEDNSNISEISSNKRKKIWKAKVEEGENKVEIAEENSEDIVDWNLDDEEENKKIENIKKEIIEDEYKRNLEATSSNHFANQEINNENSSQEQLDDDDNGLVIDEKNYEDQNQEMKCPTCDKVFPTNEKLKYHLTYYHSRQKRFKCKMCEYQGYRKKDTMNHINFVHSANVTLETLSNYTETVSKAVNEEDVKKQNELKKNQLKIKRKMARERQRKKASEAKIDIGNIEKEKKTEDFDEISAQENEKPEELNSEVDDSKKVLNSRRKSALASMITKVDTSKEEHELFIKKHQSVTIKKEELDCEDNHCIESIFAQSSKSSLISNITRFGKVIKNIPSIDIDSSQNSRPIRNRIKPVRKDFLYDLSDLLKKEADAYREQTFQSSTGTVKRELRKRAMSTHTRETPSINNFDQPLKKLPLDSHEQSLKSPSVFNNIEDLNSKFKDQRNRRMSVFIPPTRSMFPPQPRSPPYRPPATHKNAGSAYKMAVKEFDNNRASLYEPKFLWTICFNHENEKTTEVLKTSNVSAASSILQRLSERALNAEIKSETISETSNSLTAEQLCKKFELINVTNINELDIPVSNTINLNPGATENNLMSLTLDETDNDVCVLQECSAESSDDEENDDSDAKLEIACNEEILKSSRKPKISWNRKQLEKRKSAAICQRRLTVMQRLQENKIRKSREQLFQRLINQQTEEDSTEYDLFTES